MKVLVIGSGGREHALTWKIAQSQKVDKIFVAPGNAGMADIAQCVNIKADDIAGLLDFAKNNAIDLTVVGPEAPLALGIVDLFEENGLAIFGPSKAAAYIEGSKALAKEIMYKYDVPTAKYEVFTDHEAATEYVKAEGAPIVIKADGLAAGKGVIVAMNLEEALDAIDYILGDMAFGDAGAKVVVEEFLEGEEASILAFTDGKTIRPMVSAQDHKRIFDNDEGPNTGGMGAYSPAPVYTDEIAEFVVENVFAKTVAGMEQEGRLYKGVLYAGLMISPKGEVKVLEYNARFGDPETQAVLARLKTDLVEIMCAIVENKLDEIEIEWYDEASVCVVMAAGGYPNKYESGKEIFGLKEANEDAIVFHAGTSLKDGKVVTSGGRVLGITALGSDVAEAIDTAYKATNKICFADCFYRKDIGKKALNR